MTRGTTAREVFGVASAVAFVCLPAAAVVQEKGDASRALEVQCAEYWEGHLRSEPVEATALGDRRYDALLSDLTPAGRAAEKQRLEDVRRRAAAIPAQELGPIDRVTRSVLLEETAGRLAALACEFEAWVVDPLGGPQASLLNIPSMQPVKTPEQAHAMVQRWEAMGPYLDTHIANLTGGLASGRVATRSQVEKVLESLDALLAKPDAEWALLQPLAEAHSDWKAADRAAFAKGLRRAVAEQVRPGFERYRDFLRQSVLPAARPNEKAGLVHLPGGLECYRGMIRMHTSLDWSPEEIHRIGLDEVQRIDTEMQALGAKVLGTEDRRETLKRLRSDPALHFDTREAVEAKAREALARAEAAVPRWFGTLPKKSCEVVRMEPHEEAHSTIAYYRQPALDGSRPGRYYINTFAPETRPRYEAEALAFHEAVPGHHFQITVAQELTGLPEFRKHLGCTAFVEGWALYTERLSNEMGLYSSDLDRMGMLSYDAWRACRLVVDTGMHSLGWSRQQAIDFMIEHTALAENNIVNEVDRYISWPGQALAYKLGQLEILRLREQAREEQGAAFDIRRFHDDVLRHGAVSLSTLRQELQAALR